MSYAELHCLSSFSFLRSASHPEELIERAADLGYRALAITDECSLAGIVKAHVAAERCRLHLIVGAEFDLGEQAKLIILVTDRQAYSELSALITLARRRSEKGEYQIDLKDLPFNLRHTLQIFKPGDNTKFNAQALQSFTDWSSGRIWIGVTQQHRRDDTDTFQHCCKLSQKHRVPLVACGDVHMHCRQRQPLQDTLTAIRLNKTVQTLGARAHSNGEHYLRRIETLRRCYPAALLQETLNITQRCSFSMTELRYNYPAEVVPPNLRPGDYLRHLVTAGAATRWPQGVPEKISAQIETELQLIAELRYEYYFLTVHDIVHFARAQSILCQGRGSAANSVVCYCLFITEVAPDKISLLLERFISKERDEPPDIDVDFEHERREEVIQYIYKKYSRERAALAATLITYRPRSAIRDVGKALGLDPVFIQQLSKSLAWWDRSGELEQRFRDNGFSSRSRIAQLFFRLVKEILGFPRHLSQHVGGFVITRDPISTLVPVENASMPDRTVIQWDKESLEAMGLLKIDVLALGMLSAIRKCLNMISAHHQRPMTLADIPPEDTATYDMLCRADSVGVFQVESRAQMTMLPRLRPRNFYDLVIEVAIVRPGPIQGNMVHPYLRRRQGIEPASYPNQAIRGVLERTLGIPIFQEQVIKLAMVAAGFSGGEADALRRAMASWGKNGDLDRFRDKLVAGMSRRHYSGEFAEQLFEQMKGFGAYGFPESHSASFALLVYVSAWLKCHYPAAFYASVMNSQPMGFYSPSQLIQDARRHNIAVLPVDVNFSGRDHQLEGNRDTPALRLGLRLVSGLSNASGERIENSRQQRQFVSAADLKRRAGLSTEELAQLSAAGALASIESNRYQAQWQGLGIESEKPLLAYEHERTNNDIEIAAPGEVACMQADYATTGVSLGRHPMAILRERHPELARCTPGARLPALGQRRFARVAGIVTGRQRPGSAKGVVFITLEDESGNTNVVVWEQVQERCRQALLTAKLLMVKGVVETEQNVTHLIAGELTDCSAYLEDIAIQSRDFR